MVINLVKTLKKEKEKAEKWKISEAVSAVSIKVCGRCPVCFFLKTHTVFYFPITTVFRFNFHFFNNNKNMKIMVTTVIILNYQELKLIKLIY